MSEIIINQPVVSVEWLSEHLKDENLVVLDATMNKVFDVSQDQIPKTRYFDIKNKFSNTSDPFPNAFPSAVQFQEEARKLGINNTSAIVVYDDKGIYSSARVWWLFRAYGHNNVAVLNGGFPAWIKAGFSTESMANYKGEIGDFKAKLLPNFMKFFEDVKSASKDKTAKIIDARSAKRFNCIEPEPREGLRMGNIPNSVNLPFTDILQDGVLKTPEDLKSTYNKLASEEDHVIFSCGSGITACILALGAHTLEYKNISVYDGSWTEWGTLVEE